MGLQIFLTLPTECKEKLSSKLKTKRKILGCIFSEKFVIENKKVTAINYTTTIQVLLNVKGFWRVVKQKKRSKMDSF